jgi:hypothetical protein
MKKIFIRSVNFLINTILICTIQLNEVITENSYDGIFKTNEAEDTQIKIKINLSEEFYEFFL